VTPSRADLSARIDRLNAELAAARKNLFALEAVAAQLREVIEAGGRTVAAAELALATGTEPTWPSWQSDPKSEPGV